jgi:hypothetical protein
MTSKRELSMTTKNNRDLVVIRIPILSEENWSTWLIDMRALLRLNSLWEYTQSDGTEQARGLTYTQLHDFKQSWKENSERAADLITLHICTSIKVTMEYTDFDNGFHLLEKLKRMYAGREEPAWTDL